TPEASGVSWCTAAFLRDRRGRPSPLASGTRGTTEGGTANNRASPWCFRHAHQPCTGQAVGVRHHRARCDPARLGHSVGGGGNGVEAAPTYTAAALFRGFRKSVTTVLNKPGTEKEGHDVVR